VTRDRACPHCGGSVPVNRVVCPHCNRTLPLAGAPGEAPRPPTPTYAQPPPTGPEQPVPPPPQPPPANVPPVPPPGPGQYYTPPPGYPPAGPPRITPPGPRHDDTMGIVGLIMSILGLVCCCIPILGPIGLILSIVAHTKRQTTVTWSGIIIGAIATAWFLMWVASNIYSAMHPELQQQMLEEMFKSLDLPIPDGFPRP